MDHQVPITGTALRTPRAAAVAGILFSLLLGGWGAGPDVRIGVKWHR